MPAQIHPPSSPYDHPNRWGGDTDRVQEAPLDDERADNLETLSRIKSELRERLSWRQAFQGMISGNGAFWGHIALFSFLLFCACTIEYLIWHDQEQVETEVRTFQE